MVPGLYMGLGREQNKSRVVAFVTNLVISELLHNFRAGYHFRLHPQPKWKILTQLRLPYVGCKHKTYSLSLIFGHHKSNNGVLILRVLGLGFLQLQMQIAESEVKTKGNIYNCLILLMQLKYF